MNLLMFSRKCHQPVSKNVIKTLPIDNSVDKRRNEPFANGSRLCGINKSKKYIFNWYIFSLSPIFAKLKTSYSKIFDVRTQNNVISKPKKPAISEHKLQFSSETSFLNSRIPNLLSSALQTLSLVKVKYW